MTEKRKALIHKLLKGIETGDEASVAVINPQKYIQHNPQTHEGREGLAALFKRLSKSSPRVNLVRTFSDGDYVFAHTEYDFATSRIGFEVFRFEGNMTVEHWDNIQPRKGPNSAGFSMVDGPTEAIDLDKTEFNRCRIKDSIDNIMIQHQWNLLPQYINGDRYVEHNPQMDQGLVALESTLAKTTHSGDYLIKYVKHHRLLAEGNFVLSVCEGYFNDVHTAFYDLFRLSEGKIEEHWDTTEAVPASQEWKNDNGKF